MAGLYLSLHHPSIKKAYVIGSKGILEELKIVGITPVGIEDKNKPMNSELFKQTEIDPEIGAVVYNFIINNKILIRLWVLILILITINFAMLPCVSKMEHYL